ncbi:MAG: hypothetical protein Q7S27_07510 [Nanoarchaeota archaeon]|nr:hypothetical protein [Nanoarchaeota archaeon]
MKNRANLISGSIALGLSILLLMVGPAHAFILDMNITDKTPSLGDITTFKLSAEVEENEVVPIDYFVLKLDGVENTACKFLPNATILEGCSGMTISALSSPEFGYSYGYGFLTGKFTFEIDLDTSFYSVGHYTTKLIAFTNGNSVEFLGEDLNIKATKVTACSVRAEDGLLIVEDKEITKNKLNFRIPLQKASQGQGFLTGQNKGRFSYKFDVQEIKRNDDKILRVVTNGEYKLGQKKGVISHAIITLDKKKKTVSVVNDVFQAENLEVSFMKGC